MMRCDEAINRKGEKVRVKLQGWYEERAHIYKSYYMYYDEDEVYHVENANTRKIIYTFGCNSWVKAKEIAIDFIEKTGKREVEE